MANRIKSMVGLTEKPQQARRQSDKNTPISVLLSADQLAHLDKIGTELGLNRHRLMRLIVQDFIHRWLAGERPKTRVITTKTTELDI